MVELSGRMKRLREDLVLEARRSGLKMVDIRYEAMKWNDEKDVVFTVAVPDFGLTLVESEEV